jgi:hypothetical protein
MHPHVQAFICATLQGRCSGMALALVQMRAVVTDDAPDATLIEPISALCQRGLRDLVAHHTTTFRVIFPDVWAVVRVEMQASDSATTIALVPHIGAPSFIDHWRSLYPTHLVVQRMVSPLRAALLCPP